MLNWRKPILSVIYAACGNPTLRHFRYLCSVEKLPPEKLQQIQDEKLRQLLLHAARHVPYYSGILSTAQVVKGDDVILENFQKIPLLTKEIMLREGENLYSADYKRRRAYFNQSGGSTGAPVTFLQDRNYKSWSMAHHFYFQRLGLRDPGERLIRLWGSPRDVFAASEKLSARLENWLSNTIVLNGFLMSPEQMEQYRRIWNRFKPRLVITYTSCMWEFARYVQQIAGGISSPRAIFCSAETLTDSMRQFIADVCHCPVLNQYGSREAGVIACETPAQEGLHLLGLHNKTEILDRQNQPCPPGAIGDVIITTLNNYSMPLIRYKIGDTAIPSGISVSASGLGWPLIKSLTGREMEIFRTPQGTAVPGEFFIHAIGVVHNKGHVKTFQVRQKDYDHIVIRVVIKDHQAFQQSKEELITSIRNVMGPNCRVDFEPVDHIPPSKSGKFQYTINEMNAGQSMR